jgi:virginiamycin B lyase
VPKIASFTPTTTGQITITEYTFSTASSPPTAHLITTDSKGNVWFSEGFAGSIGKYNVTTKTFKTYNVSAGLCPTPTPGTSPTPCTATPHISGIAVDSNGRVWFDDSQSNLVGFYNPSTGLVKTLALTSTSHPHDGLAIDSGGNTWCAEEFGLNLDKIPSGTL